MLLMEAFYIQSGSSNFDKVIWNVPVLHSPRHDAAVTLEGGVRNSSTATKLSWTQAVDPNGINFTYDLAMMENDSTSLIHDDMALTTNQKTLTIDPDANAKYTITLASVFNPTTTGSMREVSSYPDVIEFHTIHVDVSGINISVNHPSNTSKVNLSFNNAVVTGDSVTSDETTESSSFAINIVEQHVMYSTTNPTNALTRLASSGSNVIESIVSPATLKEFSLPVTSPATKYSFFMRLKALIKYKVTHIHSIPPPTPNVELLTTSSVLISDQTATSVGSQYIVSGIPIIGTSFTITPHPTDGNPTLNFLLDANGLEEEGFISVVMILAQDGTESKPDGEAAILLFPDTGATSNYTNSVAGSGSAPLDPRLAGGESFTTTPRTLTGAVMGTAGGEYTLTIGDVNSTSGRFNTSNLKMPLSSVSGFTDGIEMNMFMLLTTRRGTDFANRTFTYTNPPSV